MSINELVSYALVILVINPCSAIIGSIAIRHSPVANSLTEPNMQGTTR